jgi:protein-disulfide isomerase
MSNQQGMSKRQARRAQRRRSDQRNRLIWIGIVSVAAIALAAVLIIPAIRPAGEVITAEPLARPQTQANTAGDPNAPIRIEEYADFQCPVCVSFYEDVEPALVEAYIATGQVYFIFRSMGEFIGAESAAAAEAAYCAGDQDKFWEMHDTIFTNWNGENAGAFSNRRLIDFADSIALDMDEFRSCFNGGSYSGQVQQDQIDGRQAGVNATPSFLFSYTVGGQEKTELIRGLIPFEQFQQRVEAALAEMGLQ